MSRLSVETRSSYVGFSFRRRGGRPGRRFSVEARKKAGLFGSSPSATPSSAAWASGREGDDQAVLPPLSRSSIHAAPSSIRPPFSDILKGAQIMGAPPVSVGEEQRLIALARLPHGPVAPRGPTANAVLMRPCVFFGSASPRNGQPRCPGGPHDRAEGKPRLLRSSALRAPQGAPLPLPCED
jgi:hypothetical protein